MQIRKRAAALTYLTAYLAGACTFRESGRLGKCRMPEKEDVGTGQGGRNRDIHIQCTRSNVTQKYTASRRWVAAQQAGAVENNKHAGEHLILLK